jgi:hypothetical protein
MQGILSSGSDLDPGMRSGIHDTVHFLTPGSWIQDGKLDLDPDLHLRRYVFCSVVDLDPDPHRSAFI